jgi:hypothetical protein
MLDAPTVAATAMRLWSSFIDFQMALIVANGIPVVVPDDEMVDQPEVKSGEEEFGNDDVEKSVKHAVDADAMVNLPQKISEASIKSINRTPSFVGLSICTEQQECRGKLVIPFDTLKSLVDAVDMLAEKFGYYVDAPASAEANEADDGE